MSTYDVRLIDASYSVVPRDSPRGKDKEDVVVKLYGKTRDNQSITVLCPNYDPYFNLFDPPAPLKKKLNELDEVLRTEDILLEYKGIKEPFTRVYVRAPWMISSLRRNYDTESYDVKIHLSMLPDEIGDAVKSERDVTSVEPKDGYVTIITTDRVYAQRLVSKYNLTEYMNDSEAERWTEKAAFFSADIIFTNRYIYDNDLEACVRVQGNEIENMTEYTTDMVVQADTFEKCDIFQPKLKLLSFDIETSIKYDNIYCICMSMLDEESGEWTSRRISSEFMLRHDNPTPEEKKAWDDDERKMLIQFTKFIRNLDPDIITGYNINNFDLERVFERACKLFGKKDAKSTGRNAGMRSNIDILNFGRDGLGISRRENKEGAIMWSVNGRVIIDAWTGVKKELHLPRENLGYVSQHLFSDTKDNINSTKIDTEWVNRKQEVIEYCLKDAQLALRILIHPKINSVNKYMDIAIPAKLPMKEVAGGQNRMIESVLIRMVDKEGVACPVNSNIEYEYPGAYVVDTITGLHKWVIGLDFSSMYPSQMRKHNICFTTYTTDTSIPGVHVTPFIDEAGTIKAAFMPKEVKEGIIPRMVGGFLDARKEAKKKMKAAKAAGDKDAEDYYNRLQAAIKVMANATYGYFGTKFCRWYFNQFIAPSITAWAREDILSVKGILEGQGCTVVAGDTDSVMFKHSERQDIPTCEKFGKEVAEKFSQGGMQLELEKVMETFFGHAKKRYFGKIVYPEADTIIRGYENRRTDSFDLQRNALVKVMELILDDKPDEAIDFSKKTVRRVLKGNVTIEEIVKAKSVKDFDEYDQSRINGMPHVNAAKKMIAMGYEFTPGMKVAYILTNGSVTPMRVEPVIEGVPFEHKPDFKYYAEALAATLARITEKFGYDEKKLLQGDAQKGLAAFCNDDDDKNGGKMNVADFM